VRLRSGPIIAVKYVQALFNAFLSTSEDAAAVVQVRQELSYNLIGKNGLYPRNKKKMGQLISKLRLGRCNPVTASFIEPGLPVIPACRSPVLQIMRRACLAL
jgi:hypothetical protein